MHNAIEQVLKELGLTEIEIKIYTTLLKIGEAKSGEIIKEGKIKSGRVYEFFNSLIEKGLISHSIKSGVKYFVATDPKNLYHYLDEKRDEINSKEKQLKSILPNLLIKSNYSKRGKVEIYEGLEGLKNAFAKELKFKKGTELLCFGVDPSSTYNKETRDFFIYNLFKQRQKYKIKKLFGERSRGEDILVEKNSHYKYIHDDSLATIDLIENLVLIHLHYGKDIVISIEDEEFAESLRYQFKDIWKNRGSTK